MQLLHFVLFSNLVGVCAAGVACFDSTGGKRFPCVRRISPPPRAAVLTSLDTSSVTNSSTPPTDERSAKDENARSGANLTSVDFLTQVAVAANVEVQTKLASNETTTSRNVVVEVAGSGVNVTLSGPAVQTPAADTATSAPAVEQNSTVVLVLKGVVPQSKVEIITDSSNVNATNMTATELAPAQDLSGASLATAAEGMDTNATVAKKEAAPWLPFAQLAEGLSGEPQPVDNSTLDESLGNSRESGEEASHNASVLAATNESGATAVAASAAIAGVSEKRVAESATESNATRVVEIRIDLSNLVPTANPGAAAAANVSEVAPLSLAGPGATDALRLDTIGPTQAEVASGASEIKGVGLDVTSNKQNAVAVNTSLPGLNTVGPEQPAVTSNASGPVPTAEAIEAASMAANATGGDGVTEMLQAAVDATTDLRRVPKLDGNGTGPEMLIVAIPVDQASDASSTMFIASVGAEGNSSRSSFHDVGKSLGRMSKLRLTRHLRDTAAVLDSMNNTAVEKSRAEGVNSSSMASAVALQTNTSTGRRGLDGFSSNDTTDNSLNTTLGNETGNLRDTSSRLAEGLKNMQEPFLTSFLSP